MNISRIIGFIITVFVFQGSAFGKDLKCGIAIQSAPLCPEKGIEMLDDRYPVMGATVSTAKGGVKFVSQFVDTLMASSPAQPIVTVVSTKEEFQQIVNSINRKTTLTNDEKRARLTKIKHLNYEFSKDSDDNAGKINWQQDFYISQFDSKTGLPLLREVPVYLKEYSISPTLVTDIGDSFSECGVKTGDPLKVQSDTLKSGTYGGNIAGLPGGLCVLGQDSFDSNEHWQQYAKQACGDLDRVLKAPSEFLEVGHSDEFMNVIKLPKESEPCNFAIGLASPRKALEVMESAPEENLFESSFLEDSLNGTIIGICKSILMQKMDLFKLKPQDQKEKGPAVKGTARWIQSLFISESLAGADEVFDNADTSILEVRRIVDNLNELSKMIPRPDLKKSCGDLKQSDLLNLYKMPVTGYNGEQLTSRFRLVQDAIQKKMDSFKIDLKERLKKALPQCEPQIIDVPHLFGGDYDAKEKSVSAAISLFPNPTNGLMLEKTYVAPEFGNRAIRKNVENIYKNLSVEVKTVDTFFAHSLRGNLHCSTHLLRYCKPRN